jgi:hypothetical protein
MSIDGSVNLGDLNGGTTPFRVSGVLELGSLIQGSSLAPFFQQGGTFNDIAYVEGSIESPVSLPTFSVSAQGNSGVVYTGSVLDTVLPDFSVSAGTGGIELPVFSVAATGDNSALVTGAVALLPFTSSGSMEPPLALPLLGVSATGFAGDLSAGSVALLPFTVHAVSGTQADAVLPDFVVDGYSLTGAIADGDAQVRQFSVDADAFQNNSADGSVTLALFSVSAAGEGSAQIDGSITLSLFDIVAAGAVGVVSTADLTIPLFRVDAQGFMDNIGTATIVLPAFVIGGEIDSSAGSGVVVGPPAAPVAGAPTTVVLNTRLKAVTLYDGLHANSFATFNGVTLAATPNGIVALTGDDDMGAVIDASVTSGISDLGLPAMKQVLTAYVGYRSSDEMELTMITDEHHENSYMLLPVQGGVDLHASRVKFGRGVTGRYWQWKLENRNGAAFDLGHIEFHVQPHKRGV